MVDAPQRRSPLRSFAAAFRDASGAAVSIEELPFLAQVDLRGSLADGGFRTSAEAALGVVLPDRVGRVAAADGWSVLTIGPDEWLVVAPDEARQSLIARLRTALHGVHSSAIDVSGNRTVIRLSGPRAREVLRKGMAVDLHPRVFGTGRCVQSALARAQVILEQTGDEPTYRLFFRCSFAEYAATWILDAMREYNRVA